MAKVLWKWPFSRDYIFALRRVRAISRLFNSVEDGKALTRTFVSTDCLFSRSLFARDVRKWLLQCVLTVSSPWFLCTRASWSNYWAFWLKASQKVFESLTRGQIDKNFSKREMKMPKVAPWAAVLGRENSVTSTFWTFSSMIFSLNTSIQILPANMSAIFYDRVKPRINLKQNFIYLTCVNPGPTPQSVRDFQALVDGKSWVIALLSLNSKLKNQFVLVPHNCESSESLHSHFIFSCNCSKVAFGGGVTLLMVDSVLVHTVWERLVMAINHSGTA